MDKKHIFFIVITALVVIATWVFAPAAVNWLVGKNWVSNPTAAGQLGDLFGSVNALFSGLALIGVVFAIMLQQKELSLSTKELRNSATALSKQVELSADTQKAR